MDMSKLGDVSKGKPLEVMSCGFSIQIKLLMNFLVSFLIFFIVFGFLPVNMLNKITDLVMGIPRFLLKLVPKFIKKIFSSIWNAIVFVAKAVKETIIAILKILIPGFIRKFVTVTLPNFIWKLVPQFIKNIIYKIRNLFTIYLPKVLNVLILAAIYYLIYSFCFNTLPLLFTYIMGSAMGNILTMSAKKMTK